VSENDVMSAAHSWIVEGRMQAIQDCVSRGRRLEHSAEQALAGAWISLIRAWAKSPEKGQDPRRVDIEAEYALRGLKPPYELLKDELETILRTSAEAMESIDEEAKAQLNSDVLQFSATEKGKADRERNNLDLAPRLPVFCV
jgi:hypothetical protein